MDAKRGIASLHSEALSPPATRPTTMSPKDSSPEDHSGLLGNPNPRTSFGTSHHNTPVQGPSLFSTDGGKISPRPAPIPREQQIVHSDFKQSVLDYCVELRTKHPLICNMVFAPWDIRTFFDEHDFYRYGGDFLYTVLMNLMEENGKRVVSFCLTYMKVNMSTYGQWCQAARPLEEMFAEEDREEHGDYFLGTAIKCLQECYQRAEIQHKATIQKNLLNVGTASDFSKAIPDRYYNNDSRSPVNYSGSFRNNQKIFSPEKQRVGTNRGQDQYGIQNGFQSKTGTMKRKNPKAKRWEDTSSESSSLLPHGFTPEPPNIVQLHPGLAVIPSFTGPPLFPQPGFAPPQHMALPFPAHISGGTLHSLAPMANVFVAHDFSQAFPERAPWTERDGPNRERGGSIRGRGNGRGGARDNNRRSSLSISDEPGEARPRRLSSGGEGTWRLRQTTSHPPILESQAETPESANASDENLAPRASPATKPLGAREVPVAAQSFASKVDTSTAFVNQLPLAYEPNEVLKMRPSQSGIIRSRSSQQDHEVTLYHVPEHREDVVEVHVSTLLDIMEDEDIRELLSKFGTVRNVNIRRGSNSGARFALVEFSDSAAVRRAISPGQVMFQGRGLSIKVSSRYLPVDFYRSGTGQRYSPQDVRSSLSPDLGTTILPPSTPLPESASIEAPTFPEHASQPHVSVINEEVSVLLEQPRDIQTISDLDLGEQEYPRVASLARGAAKGRQDKLDKRASPTRKQTLSTSLSIIGEVAEPTESAETYIATDSAAAVEDVETSGQVQDVSEPTVVESQPGTSIPTSPVSATQLSDADALVPAEAQTHNSVSTGVKAVEPVLVVGNRDGDCQQIDPGRNSIVAGKTDDKRLNLTFPDEMYDRSLSNDDEGLKPTIADKTAGTSSPNVQLQLTAPPETITMKATSVSQIEAAQAALRSTVAIKPQNIKKPKAKSSKVPSTSSPLIHQTASTAVIPAAGSSLAFKLEAPGGSEAMKIKSLSNFLGASSTISSNETIAGLPVNTAVQKELVDPFDLTTDDNVVPVIVTARESATEPTISMDSAVHGTFASLVPSPSTTKSSPFGGLGDVPPELRKLHDAIEKAKLYKPYQLHHVAELKASLANCKRKFNALKFKMDDLATSTPGGTSKTMNKTKNKKLKKIQDDLDELEEEVAVDLKKYEFLQTAPVMILTKEQQEQKKKEEHEDQRKTKDEQDQKKAKEEQDRKNGAVNERIEVMLEDVGRSENGTYRHTHSAFDLKEINTVHQHDKHQASKDAEGGRSDEPHVLIMQAADFAKLIGNNDEKSTEERRQRQISSPTHPHEIQGQMDQINRACNASAQDLMTEMTPYSTTDTSEPSGLSIFSITDLFPDINKANVGSSGTISPSSERGDSSQGVPGKDLTAALKKAQDYDSTPRHLRVPPVNAPKVMSPPITSPGLHSYARAASSSATPSIDSFIKDVDALKSAAAIRARGPMSSSSTRASSNVRGDQRDGANDEDEWTAKKPWGPGGFKAEENADNVRGSEGHNRPSRKRNKGKGKAMVGGVPDANTRDVIDVVRESMRRM